MQAMRQPLLSGAEIASTDENDRLQDLAIESRARHEGGAASAGTRFTAHEALFRNGQGYAYGKQVALDVRTLRGILVKPDPPASKRCAPDLQYQQRLALWEELQQAHHSKHLYPIPEGCRDLFKRLVVLLVVFMTICTSAAVAELNAEHRGDEGHGGSVNHGDEHTSGVPAWASAQVKVVTVFLLIIATLLFEAGKETLEHEIPREMRGVLSQVFAEFTVLGFLAMTAYFVVHSRVLGELSVWLYGDEEKLDQIFACLDQRFACLKQSFA